MPGVLMAISRCDRPAVIVYGGTIRTGRRTIDCPGQGKKRGDPINIVDTFLAHGAYLTGKIEEKHLEDVVAHACPGEGQLYI